MFVVACGSAYHAGLIGKQAIEHWTRVPVEVEMASEFRYRDPVLDQQTLVVAISQSGETADTLEAVRHAREQNARVLAICNTNGAQIPRESDAVLYMHAGPEIGVAATKTFLAQVAAVELVGLALAQARGTKYGDEIAREFDALAAMPRRIHDVLGLQAQVAGDRRADRRRAGGAVPGPAHRLPDRPRGRAQAQGTGLHARRGFPGRRAQARPDRARRDGRAGVVVIMPPVALPLLHQKMVSNIAEVKARGARTIVIAEDSDPTARAHADHVITVPAVPTLLQPFVATVPLQMLAAGIAMQRGYDIDKPRNLAKSVTVE